MVRNPAMLFASVALLVLPILAEGATFPCFQYDCVGGTCTVDPSCSSADPFIWKVVFDWGDGTSTGFVAPGVPYSHTYANQAGCSEAVIKLTVWPWSDDIRSVSCPVLYTFCPYGGVPPSLYAGTCS